MLHRAAPCCSSTTCTCIRAAGQREWVFLGIGPGETTGALNTHKSFLFGQDTFARHLLADASKSNIASCGPAVWLTAQRLGLHSHYQAKKIVDSTLNSALITTPFQGEHDKMKTAVTGAPSITHPNPYSLRTSEYRIRLILRNPAISSVVETVGTNACQRPSARRRSQAKLVKVGLSS